MINRKATNQITANGHLHKTIGPSNGKGETPPRSLLETHARDLDSKEIKPSEDDRCDSEHDQNNLVRIFMGDQKNPHFIASQPHNGDSNPPPSIPKREPAIQAPKQTLVKLPLPPPLPAQDTPTPQPHPTVNNVTPPPPTHLLKPRPTSELQVKKKKKTYDHHPTNKRELMKRPIILPKPSGLLHPKSQKVFVEDRQDLDPLLAKALTVAREHQNYMGARRFELKEAFYCRRIKQQLFEGMRLNDYHRFSSIHKPGNLFALHQNHIKELLKSKRAAFLGSRQSMMSRKKEIAEPPKLMTRDLDTSLKLERISNQTIPSRGHFKSPRDQFMAPGRPPSMKGNGGFNGHSMETKLRGDSLDRSKEDYTQRYGVSELYHQRVANYPTFNNQQRFAPSYQAPPAPRSTSLPNSLIHRTNRVLDSKSGLCCECQQKESASSAGLCYECYHKIFK